MRLVCHKAAMIFDGQTTHESSAMLVEGGAVKAIVQLADVPGDARVIDHGDNTLCPGFVDVQVNGGGGVMFNDSPSVESMETICAAHASFGTKSLLPTLITDTPANTARAVLAAIEAQKLGVKGFAGLHLEGPHLSQKRNGAHDPTLIRHMDASDLAALLRAREQLPTLLTTVAPESVSPGQISAMAKAGIIVSLGHTDCTYDTAMRCFDAGATMVTHLFNAMSQLGNREPGLVGAALASGAVSAGLIADGFHVHPATMRAALRAKTGAGSVFLVTDAMATVGSDIQSFMLNGREILRCDGRLTLADGTLAGADIDMISCVRFAHERLGLTTADALGMATGAPARAIGRADIGHLRAGSEAVFLILSPGLHRLKGAVSQV
jgi:N-acetylglucosamine-6-phosphate deacetylase